MIVNEKSGLYHLSPPTEGEQHTQGHNQGPSQPQEYAYQPPTAPPPGYHEQQPPYDGHQAPEGFNPDVKDHSQFHEQPQPGPYPQASGSSYPPQPPYDQNAYPQGYAGPPKDVPYGHVQPYPSDPYAQQPPQQEFNSADPPVYRPPRKGPGDTPSCFSRPPASNLAYPPFVPLSHLGNGEFPADGFPRTHPMSYMQEAHPFASHDVQPNDWTRFVEDLGHEGAISGTQKFAAGLLMSGAMIRGMKSRKKESVGQLVDAWNHFFFHPRRMEVILVRGTERFSGGEPGHPAWEAEVQRLALGLHHSNSSDSSVSAKSVKIDKDNESKYERALRKDAEKAARKERRAKKEIDRENRKREKAEAKLMRLFIVPV